METVREQARTRRTCACRSHDAWECSAIRYGRLFGGSNDEPCYCACHEDDECEAAPPASAPEVEHG